MPHTSATIEDLQMADADDSESTTVSSIMAMTKTRRKQKQELIRRALDEAQHRQSSMRDAFTLRMSPATLHAAYEPALFMTQTAAVDNDDDDDLLAHVPARTQMAVAQPLFPSCLLAVTPQLVDLLDDTQVDADGVSGKILEFLKL